MNTRISRILLVYTLVVSTLAAGALVTQAIGAQSKASFDEIDVRRINLREEDGTLRLVISNTHRLPGIIHKGKEMPHPNRRTAGMLFFNEEGTENGGLSFSGRTENGKVSSSGHLSFDQYEQDQVIQITQTENNGVRRATFGVADRPDKSMDFAGISKMGTMPEGPAKEAAMKQLIEGGSFGVKQRVLLGKMDDRSSALYLFDAEGRPRIGLQVTAEGAAAMKFMDEKGKTVHTVTASGDEREK